MGNMWPVVAPQTAVPNILIAKNFIPLFSWRWLMRIINLYGLMLAEQGRLSMRKYATTRNLYVVASLDKALYDDYICLVASNKQQIQW